MKPTLAGQIGTAEGWDFRWSVSSVATSLAMYWGEEIGRLVGGEARKAGMSSRHLSSRPEPTRRSLLEALSAACDRLTPRLREVGDPVGRHQPVPASDGRHRAALRRHEPSIPVRFTSARWGSLASLVPAPANGTKKWYGTTGNSFVAVVEFGDACVPAP